MNFPILSTLIFLPLISSIFIFLSKSLKNNNSAIYVSLFTSIATFLLSLFIWYSLDQNSPEFLVIVGAGGLGLMGVQIASAITDAKIICVDLDDAKLETAKEMGAHFTVNSKDPETVQKIMSICNDKGADSVVDFVNAPPTVKTGLAVLRKRGNLVLVGLCRNDLK